MTEQYTAFYHSPIGIFEINGSAEGVHELKFTELETATSEPVPGCLQNCFQQLDEYFAGTRTKFELILNPGGTPFQQKVWQKLLNIPYGKITTYLEIARALDNVKAIRAVGAANGANKIPVIIPCHRVIGSNGALIGFGGGIWRKEYLLKHERAVLV